MNEERYARSIELPGCPVFRNLKNAKRFAIDIGGSLTKIAYYSTISHRKISYGKRGGVGDTTLSHSDDAMSSDEETQWEVYEGGRLHFVKFETKYIEMCLDFIQRHLVGSRETMTGKKIKVTGGGSFKYSQVIHEKLGLLVEKEDEMESLIRGCNFLLKNIPDEVFTYHRHANPEYCFQLSSPDVFPYLLVNIGSGVSIMKVESEEKYERIGGTATGGGTFWGLGSLLTSAKKFDELLELAERGDHRHIDMLVRDIYGGDYHTLGLPGDLIASSFGKAAYLSRIEGKGLEYNEADVARSLLFTISNDIGQISCLYAIQHSLKDVYFGGYFLRGHPLSMHTISYAINYWGKGQVRALFLRHEGYLGAIGAFLKGAHEDPEKYSWSENYAGSSGLRSPIPMQLLNPKYSVSMDQLEMDQFHMQLSFCPLLANPHIYKPDTVDLNQDTQAREYWLQLFEETVDGFIEEAVRSQAETPDSVTRAATFRNNFLSRLHYLQREPYAYGKLTVRSLLDMREHMLNESEFDDPYLLRKQEENEAALKSLASRLKYLDALGYQERQVRLIEGILAGNVFDWGAKEVAACLRQGNFHFDDAHQSLQKRPWLMDDLDVWMRRREEGPSYRCVAVFVDNSGMDIILGVIPFVRDFLSAGSQVLLCANSAPALNDVTYRELKVLMEDVAKVCPVIKDALAQGILSILESGQGSPCLDLSRLSRELCEAMESRGVDLVVLEGMGRAVHTNFHAEFTCDTLHLAVIKNRWLAQRLGGDMYAIICLFRQPTLS